MQTTTTIMAKREPIKSVKYPMSIEENLYNRAFTFATSKGISIAGVIRMALIEFLDRNAPSA
ncbi:MAG: hypothetical protein V4714_10840 [Bacteroidota bacterium]